jgi:hypothetical protein
MGVDTMVGAKAMFCVGAIVLGLVVAAYFGFQKQRRLRRSIQLQAERMAHSLLEAVRRENELIDEQEQHDEPLAAG